MEIKLNNKYKATVFGQENEGLGVSKIEDLIVFVKNGLPGDEGDVLITELKKNFARGKMMSFDKKSEERQAAPCPYYDECGGCDLQHQTYTNQLAFKTQKIKTALERIGGFKDMKINNIIFGEEFNYRNKVTLKVQGDKLGFYKHRSNDIIDIKNCMISDKKINDAIEVMQSFIKQYKKNGFEAVMIRYSTNGLMIRIDGKNSDLSEELVSFLSSKLDCLKSLTLNGKTIYGDDYVEEKIDHLTFKLSPTSFYQVNSKMMAKLYSKALEYVSQTENETILDLYCGIGTITSLLAGVAKRVIGIEVDASAIANATENLAINGINNVIFMQGKVEEALTQLLDEKVDTVVMDPPRDGVERSVLESILVINPKQIVYVSCNPVTLARDMKILCSEKYDLVELSPFDMFPQTNHVECVAKLVRK